MARIRSLKPEFFLSERVASVSFGARLLFQGLWTVADREGRLRWQPRKLKAQLFPYDDVELFPWAEELVTAGVVRFYDDDDGVYCWVVGFTEHQRPHPKEPASALPGYPSGRDHGWLPWKKTAESRELPGSIPSSPVGREGKGREGKGAGPLIARYDPSAAFQAPTFRVPGGWERDTLARANGRLTRTDLLAFYADFQRFVETEQPDLTGDRLFRVLDRELGHWRERRDVDAEMQAGRDTVRKLREFEANFKAKQAGGAA